ncbi:hypothetical protein [Mycolicibacterium sp. PDY-3]|uniref:hypothetical protein n=1 Tax=Mycolicibacterium sp. PDY-3 TaxID=3376069 RepID=UPI00379B2A27
MTSPSQGGQSWVKWLVIAVAVIVVGSGAWYAWGYFAAKGQLAAVKDQVGSSQSASSGAESTEIVPIDGTKIDITTYPHEGDVDSGKPSFESLPVGTQIDAVAPFVDEHIQEWYSSYQKLVFEKRGPNAKIGDETLAPISVNNDATTIVNRNLAIVHAQWNELDTNTAENITSANTMPGTDEYGLVLADISKHKDGYVSPMWAGGALPTFEQGSFHYTYAGGYPTVPLLVMNHDTGKTYVNVYQLRRGEKNPDAKAWLLVDAGPINSPIGDAYKASPYAMDTAGAS